MLFLCANTCKTKAEFWVEMCALGIEQLRRKGGWVLFLIGEYLFEFQRSLKKRNHCPSPILSDWFVYSACLWMEEKWLCRLKITDQIAGYIVAIQRNWILLTGAESTLHVIRVGTFALFPKQTRLKIRLLCKWNICSTLLEANGLNNREV